MAFFAGASNVKIFGGSFVNNEGDTVNDHRHYTTNVNSNNQSTSNMNNSNNDNSRISGSGEMPSMRPRSAGHREEDYIQPQPQWPQHPSPPQLPSSGGTATNNINSYNRENTNVTNAFNNNSRNYYQGGVPPNNSRQNYGPQWMSGSDQGPPSISGAHPSGQFQAPFQAPFQAAIPHPMGPHTSVIGANIQPLGQQMGEDFGNWLNSTISHAQSMAAGTGGGNYQPQAANPSSSRDVDDSMNTVMANLTLNDHQPQISTHLAPPTSLLPDRQVSLRATDQMGSSNLSNGNLGPYNGAVQQGSHLNTSLALRMNEPKMVDIFSPPTDTRPSHGNNLNRLPPPTSTSALLSVVPNSNFNKHDHSVHRMNIGSFNEKNNTLRDSYNDNSLFDATGRHSADDHSSRVDEELSLEETDEQIPTAVESTVVKKKKRFPFFRKK